jgi:hypothetical protein
MGAVLITTMSWLDLKIIALSQWKVIKRGGINRAGQATAEEFKGTEAA